MTQAGAGDLSPMKKALLAIEHLQEKLSQEKRARREPIAIIGMGCRFPGSVQDPASFADLLWEGKEGLGPIPKDRFGGADLYDADPATPGKMYMQRGGFLDDVDQFDPAFFRITPREAAWTDPQQRLFMEVCWEALEQAGIDPFQLKGSRTGVFAGAHSHDYANLVEAPANVNAHYSTGMDSSYIAGRVSYFLGLQGPALAVDTACSSSLTAVHLAVRSLRAGESDLALAGGVKLILSPEISMFLCKAGAMSPSGRCAAFDKRADGMVQSEGCGAVVLKRLSCAVRDGDPILAVIRGTAVNHDGASGGLTVPNPMAQAQLLETAISDAGIQPADLSYLEAHGTGTSLGDPVELAGIARAYCAQREPGQVLPIGSVKSNIGHAESAAGMAGLIKAVLILQRGEIPPSLHFQEPNPEFDWSNTPLQVAGSRMPLPKREAPHLVGISAFGMSGINGHTILEAYEQPARQATEPSSPVLVLPISAHSSEALQARVADLEKRIKHPSFQEKELHDLVYTAARRRAHHGNRLSVTFSNREELRAALTSFLHGEDHAALGQDPLSHGHESGPVFVFSGQGPQWWGMGRELAGTEPVFRSALERIDAFVREYAGWSCLEELNRDEQTSRLNETRIAQVCIFAVQAALVSLWEAYGIKPAAVVGHSVGEVAAAWCAGVYDLPQAVRIIIARGRLMQESHGLGRMLMASCPPEQLEDLLEADQPVSIAAYNSPDSTVISGDHEALDAVSEALQARGVKTRMLPGDYAFHLPADGTLPRRHERRSEHTYGWCTAHPHGIHGSGHPVGRPD